MFNIIQTVLTNFGNTIYTGSCVNKALESAKQAGFEAIILNDGALVATFSPISGIRKY